MRLQLETEPELKVSKQHEEIIFKPSGDAELDDLFAQDSGVKPEE